MEKLGIKTQRGETLADLYDLQVIASYTFGTEERTDNVSLYVYKPEQR
jgi:hypothetical protein